jgi:hypothetical protein
MDFTESNKQNIPMTLVEALSFVALLYGACLAATVPWAFTSVHASSMAEQILKISFMVIFSLIMCRWLVVQYIALREFRKFPRQCLMDGGHSGRTPRGENEVALSVTSISLCKVYDQKGS